MVCLIFYATTSSSQGLKKKQLRTLTELGVPNSYYDVNNKKILTDFQKIVWLDQRRRGQGIAGAILLPLGAVALGYGASRLVYGRQIERSIDDLPEEPDRGREARAGWNQVGGGLLVLVGTAELSVGIPMLFSARKKKKNRDVLLAEYGAIH